MTWPAVHTSSFNLFLILWSSEWWTIELKQMRKKNRLIHSNLTSSVDVFVFNLFIVSGEITSHQALMLSSGTKKKPASHTNLIDNDESIGCIIWRLITHIEYIGLYASFPLPCVDPSGCCLIDISMTNSTKWNFRFHTKIYSNHIHSYIYIYRFWAM